MENICAIATPYGRGAISIIRCSGPNSIELVNKVFKGRDLTNVKGNRIVYGHIYDGNDLIDEVMVSVFRSPKSYDGENACEINCHGGVYVTELVLQTLLKVGFRMAEPGEFTKRAFLNHKMDLTSAESVMDVVNAESKLALTSSLNALNNNLSKLINNLRDILLDLLAKIEVNIDYPEYEDSVDVTHDYLSPHLDSVIKQMEEIVSNSKISRIIINGVKTAIVGKPNVGKSTLLNLLLGENKAIVSDIAGTTRDIVEGQIRLGDISLNLLDTAGIRDNTDLIESIGINKAKETIKKADLILLVLDISRKLEEDDLNLIELIKDKPHLIIANKKDLKPVWMRDDVLMLSAKEGEGLKELKDKIYEVLKIKDFNATNPSLNNVRQKQLMEEALISLKQAKNSCLSLVDISLIDIDIKEAFDKLGEIIGKSYPEELITALFTKFCLGK